MDFSSTVFPELPKDNIYGSNLQWSHMSYLKDSCNFVFTISNYSLVNKKNKECIESPRFNMEFNKNIKWYLQLYPEGVDEETKDFISLFVCRHLDSTTNVLSEIKASYYYGIIDKNKNHIKFDCLKIFNDKVAKSWGRSSFIKKDDLFKKKETLLPDDTLTIFCSITASFDYKTDTKIVCLDESKSISRIVDIIDLDKLSITPNLSEDNFETMFKNHVFSDITLIVDNQELKAHKCLLAVASPVFALIFEKDLSVESIEISDISAEAIYEMLRFIYTKKINNLKDLAHELIVVANKYAIQNLKNLCEEELCKNIDIDNVLKLIVIAEENGASCLKKLAISFILKNKKELGPKPEFKEIITSHPRIMESIFWFEMSPDE